MAFVAKTKYFAKWAKQVGLADEALLQAVAEMMQGLVDADLGGGVVKKRIALGGQGKRGGSRTILATISGSLSLGLRRMSGEMYLQKSWRRCSH